MMLHVKRLKGRLAVSFQDKEFPFGKELLTAFSIALLLHILFFSLFKVTTTSREQNIALTPIHVEVDIHSSKLEHPLSLFPVEQSILPHLPTPYLSIPTQENSYQIGWQEPDFSSIEEIDYESIYIDFDDDNDRN